MRELEIKFEGKGEVKGFSFEQIYFENGWYIYQVTEDSTGLVHYEVFVRKENTFYNVVTYPKAVNFGVWAWSCYTFEDAKKYVEC